MRLLLSALPQDFPPIVVMSYKNHALDSFLLSLVDESKGLGPKDVARIGGGGKIDSQILKECNLKTLMRSAERDNLEFREYKQSQRAVLESSKELVAEVKKLQILDRNFSFESFLRTAEAEQIVLFLKRTKAKEDVAEYFDPPLERHSGEEFVEFLQDDDELWKDCQQKFDKLFQFVSVPDFTPMKINFQKLFKQPPSIKQRRNSQSGIELEDFPPSETDVEEIKYERGGYQSFNKDDDFYATFSIKALSFLNLNMELGESEKEILLCHDPWLLEKEGRGLLIYLLQARLVEDNQWQNLTKNYEEALKRYNEASKRWECSVLAKKRVIFLTISGAAMKIDILRSLGPKILLLEEAAEILEPQLLAAMPPSIQHVISIGDHHQLRPAVEFYRLSVDKNFDISLFERMIANGAQYVCLEFQGRMRSEIAKLLLYRYPCYKDNVEVIKHLPEVSCSKENLFFFDHDFEEDATHHASKSNKEEAKLVISLIFWFLLSNYEGSQLTILSPYLKQVRIIRKMLQEEAGRCQNITDSAAQISICTVDQYQGNENDIVFLSLVRGNNEQNIGFLRLENRVTVALSRARSGLFIFGNSKTFYRAGDTKGFWNRTLKTLQQGGNFGKTIYLQCPKHLDTSFMFQVPVSNDIFFKGLCDRICNQTKPCGHICRRRCHPEKDNEGHINCKEVVMVELPCGHNAEKACFLPLNRIKCSINCMEILSCGHMCPGKCGEDCEMFVNTCPCCIEELRAKEEIQRKIASTRRRQGMIEAQKRVRSLKKDLKSFEKRLFHSSKIGTNDPEYMEISNRVESSVDSRHGVLVKVSSIEKIVNIKLQLNQQDARLRMHDPNCHETLLFSTTFEEDFSNIVQKGFSVPHGQQLNTSSSPTNYGLGVYLSVDSFPKHGTRILVCRTLLGLCKTVVTADQNLHDFARRKTEQYDSVLIKSNVTAMEQGKCNEYVVYDPRLVLPSYIVTVQRRAVENSAMSFNTSADNIVVIEVDRSNKIPGSEEEFFAHYLSLFFEHHSGRFEATKVHILPKNEELLSKFQEKKQQFEQQNVPSTELFAFHGTPERNIKSILEKGLLIGGKSADIAVAHGIVLGYGVYTARYPDLSADYTNGGNKILILKILPGTTSSVKYTGDTPPPGKHSYTNGNVVILFEEDQVLPMAVVEFQSKHNIRVS